MPTPTPAAETPVLPVIPVLIGPTAVGKSEVALQLAEAIDADLLLVDAYKVYRELHIGVTKPAAADRARVKHFGLDLLSVFEAGNVERVVTAAETTLDGHAAAGRRLIIEGNAPLYLKILFEGMFTGPGQDPALRATLTEEAASVGTPALHSRLAAIDPTAAARIEINDLRRIVRALEVQQLTGQPISRLQGQWGQLRSDRRFAIVGLRTEKSYLWQRMRSRVETMLDQGWLEECRTLKAMETDTQKLSRTAAQAEGYAQLFELLATGGELTGETREGIVESIFIGHRQNARRALQWYRKWAYVEWIDRGPDSSAAELAEQVRAAWRRGGVAC